MNAIPRNILSVLLSIVFAAVATTGVMMFFKIRILSSESIHIWLGLTFVVISCLHLLKNWSAFATYFQKKVTLLPVIFGCIVITAFIVTPLFTSQEKTVNPKTKIITTMMNAPLSKLAAFVDLDEEKMIKLLTDQHILASHQQSISEIARANNKTNDDILKIVFSTPSSR